MLLNIPLMADWQMITQKRGHSIHENLHQANAKQRRYDYEINQKILKSYTNQQN